MGVYHIPVRGSVWVEAASAEEAVRAAEETFGREFRLADREYPRAYGVFRAQAVLRQDAVAPMPLSADERTEQAERRVRLFRNDYRSGVAASLLLLCLVAASQFLLAAVPSPRFVPLIVFLWLMSLGCGWASMFALRQAIRDRRTWQNERRAADRAANGQEPSAVHETWYRDLPGVRP